MSMRALLIGWWTPRVWAIVVPVFSTWFVNLGNFEINGGSRYVYTGHGGMTSASRGRRTCCRLEFHGAVTVEASVWLGALFVLVRNIVIASCGLAFVGSFLRHAK
jgi:hypothetical protein